MPAQFNNCYAATCGALSSAIMDLSSRIRVSHNNQKIKDDNESQVDTYTKSISICDTILQLLKPTLDDVKQYINTKRAESMQSINNALRLAEEVVPDSEAGVHFELDGDKALLLAEDGLTVSGTEGDGFCQVSSTFLRAVIAQYNPAILSTLIFDEVFSQLSQENSATLSLYLNILCQNAQIISIEQKPQVYSNIDCTMYTFNKTGEIAEVTKTIVKRGELDGNTPTEGAT